MMREGKKRDSFEQLELSLGSDFIKLRNSSRVELRLVLGMLLIYSIVFWWFLLSFVESEYNDHGGVRRKQRVSTTTTVIYLGVGTREISLPRLTSHISSP